MIPTEAVIPEIRGKKVFIIKNGKAKSVPIETGVRTSSQVEVLTGLQNGDSVITSGIMQLKPDMLVKVVKPKKLKKPYTQMTAKELAKATAQFDDEFIIYRSVKMNASQKAQWQHTKRKRKDSH